MEDQSSLPLLELEAVYESPESWNGSDSSEDEEKYFFVEHGLDDVDG